MPRGAGVVMVLSMLPSGKRPRYTPHPLLVAIDEVALDEPSLDAAACFRAPPFMLPSCIFPSFPHDTIYPTLQTAVDCERAFLAALDGNCKTPIAGQVMTGLH